MDCIISSSFSRRRGDAFRQSSSIEKGTISTRIESKRHFKGSSFFLTFCNVVISTRVVGRTLGAMLSNTYSFLLFFVTLSTWAVKLSQKSSLSGVSKLNVWWVRMSSRTLELRERSVVEPLIFCFFSWVSELVGSMLRFIVTIVGGTNVLIRVPWLGHASVKQDWK